MKMYKKPITDTILISADEMMNPSLGVSPGGTETLDPGTVGSAPKRRLF